MFQLDLTLASAEENLACDEALLDWCEAGSNREILRFWMPRQYFVVVGYGNACARETHLDACRADRVPVLRRCSGGGAVLQGPGCLNYTLVLEIERHPRLPTVTEANRFIMERHRDALTGLLAQPVQVRGHTDLTLGNLKFSGNSQRRRRRCLLFHGTFLLAFDIALVGRYLSAPSREPDYRQLRSHAAFLTALPLPEQKIQSALIQVWQATTTLVDWPRQETERLVREKYARPEWNFQR